MRKLAMFCSALCAMGTGCSGVRHEYESTKDKTDTHGGQTPGVGLVDEDGKAKTVLAEEIPPQDPQAKANEPSTRDAGPTGYVSARPRQAAQGFPGTVVEDSPASANPAVLNEPAVQVAKKGVPLALPSGVSVFDREEISVAPISAPGSEGARAEAPTSAPAAGVYDVPRLDVASASDEARGPDREPEVAGPDAQEFVLVSGTAEDFIAAGSEVQLLGAAPGETPLADQQAGDQSELGAEYVSAWDQGTEDHSVFDSLVSAMEGAAPLGDQKALTRFARDWVSKNNELVGKVESRAGELKPSESRLKWLSRFVALTTEGVELGPKQKAVRSMFAKFSPEVFREVRAQRQAVKQEELREFSQGGLTEAGLSPDEEALAQVQADPFEGAHLEKADSSLGTPPSDPWILP